MCGIVGYIGMKDCKNIILTGLKKLEYRGYDSAGIATIKNGELLFEKTSGKIEKLEEKLQNLTACGNIGIGHTRWATHGRPTDVNAHPHNTKDFSIAHNGIIENYKELKDELVKKGFEFRSQTDSEVIVQLIQKEFEKTKSIKQAILNAVSKLEGSFAFVLLSHKAPDKIYAVKSGSPIVIGIGNNENYIASDVPAMLHLTKNFIFMEDEEIAEIGKTNVEITNFKGSPLKKKTTTIEWTPSMTEKGNYNHYMQKEIFEQPQAILDTISKYLVKEKNSIEFEGNPIDFDKIDNITIVACGTSYHAGLIGKFIIEKLSRIPVNVELASEFRYRNPIINEKTLIIPISQSGETADTLAAVEEGRSKKAKILGICNAFQSTLARKADYTLFTQAGLEIGVASTKAFTTQISILYLIAIYLAKNTLNQTQKKSLMENLYAMPFFIDNMLSKENKIKNLAKKYHKYSNFLYLGRGINYPIALEGALKLKEISYIHAEGYAAGEMKHGPIALIDENMPVIIIAPHGSSYEKIISNLEEVKAREGMVISLLSRNDKNLKKISSDYIEVPEVDEFFTPILTSIPLQLFAYHVAVLRGTDVDQPRNLAKSVTVE